MCSVWSGSCDLGPAACRHHPEKAVPGKNEGFAFTSRRCEEKSRGGASHPTRRKPGYLTAWLVTLVEMNLVTCLSPHDAARTCRPAEGSSRQFTDACQIFPVKVHPVAVAIRGVNAVQQETEAVQPC